MNLHPKYRRRLLKLASLLEDVPSERFNYILWSSCPLGLAATMPEFRRLGLVLRQGVPGLAKFYSAWPSDAASEVFGVTFYEFNVLFSGHGELENGRSKTGATPKQAARHIRRFVAEQTKLMGGEA